MRFRNPIGLAAGFDKNGIAAPALAALGFGFITVGSVTPRAGQPGNPRPRLFRDVPNRALWNRLGFNNRGADTLATVLERQPRLPVPLGISLGKARQTPIGDAFEDYAYSLEKLYPYEDFFEICISSPNTLNLRELAGRQPAGQVANQPGEEGRRSGTVRRHGGGESLSGRSSPRTCRPFSATSRWPCAASCWIPESMPSSSATAPSIPPSTRTPEKGGYSGRPLFLKALDQVTGAAARLDGGLTLVGNGGIFDGHDAYTMMKQSGCPLVQVHSALPYRGPMIARRMRQELLQVMDRQGVRHVSEIGSVSV